MGEVSLHFATRTTLQLSLCWELTATGCLRAVMRTTHMVQLQILRVL